MIRPEIGITAFLGPDSLKPWPCVFKQMYSDFIVLEVLQDGTVCQVASGEEDLQKGGADEKAKKLPLKLSAEDTEKLQKLADLKTVLVDVKDWTKDERRELHEYVRSLGHFDSSTEGDRIKAFVPKPGGGRKRKAWPPNQPPHLHFTLSKEDYETNFALELVAKFLGRTTQSFGTCGMKDRRAITAQRVSGYQVEIPALLALNARLRGIRLSKPAYSEQRLSLGDLWGNRFSVALRDFTEWQATDLKDGFINFFGEQRFGSFATLTSDVGLQILRQDFEAAVRLLLQPKENSQGPLHGALLEYELSQDPAKALEYLKGALKHACVEQKVLHSLKVSPGNWRAAILAIPRLQRSLYVHAYQSKVFNTVASRRAQKFGRQVLDGDRFNELAEHNTIENVVLPLPCFPLRLPENEVADWYREILTADGLTEDNFRDLHRDFAVTESSRAFLAKPRDVEYELVAYAQERDHLQNAPPFAQAAAEPSADCTAPRHALRVRFSLPSGTYATMALRELLRVDLSKQAQRKAAEERASAGAGADENAKTEAGDDQNVKMDCGDAKEDATKVSTDDHKE